MDEKVSVIMSVYNGEKYLKSSISSVLNQTYSKFIFYIVDDCSTDSSLEIIQSFNDSRIKIVINSENLGLTKSLNKCISLVNTKYVARMDADDICIKERFMHQFDLLEKKELIGFVGTSAFIINKDDDIIGEINPPLRNLKEALFFRNSFIHSSIMIRTCLIQKIMYDENLKYAQDYNLWVKCIQEMEGFNIQYKLIKYRKHNDNISIIKKERQEECVLESIKLNLRRLGIVNKSNLHKYAIIHLNYFIKNKSDKSLWQGLSNIAYFRIVRSLNKKIKYFNSNFDEEIHEIIKEERKKLIFKFLSTRI